MVLFIKPNRVTAFSISDKEFKVLVSKRIGAKEKAKKRPVTTAIVTSPSL